MREPLESIQFYLNILDSGLRRNDSSMNEIEKAGSINLKPVKKIDELQKNPGVGKSIAEDLRNLGIKQVKDLRNRNPEELHNALCKKMGKHVDCCVLYVFRCAVYFASHKKHDPEKLKWWYWKDSR